MPLYTFDDNHFGTSDNRNERLQEKLVARPPGLRIQEWHRVCGQFATLLNRVDGPARPLRDPADPGERIMLEGERPVYAKPVTAAPYDQDEATDAALEREARGRDLYARMTARRKELEPAPDMRPKSQGLGPRRFEF